MDKKGKFVSIRVCFLDDHVHAFQLQIKADGLVLWEQVVSHLELVESDFFDLEYTNAQGVQNWLDREKAVLKQLPGPDTPVRFLVKFYTPDPAILVDEYTRYFFALQIKKDLITGALSCSDNTMALLASYIAQSEVGDFPIDDYADHTYLRANNLRYVPHQTEEMEKKIMEYHKQHTGETQAEAEINLLDTARKVELYGIRMVPTKDHDNVPLNLAVCHSGILVFQAMTKINTFSWAKIRKLSFKRKRLLIKLHPENSAGYCKDLVEFFFDSRDECKTFWKKCIEYHGFFRCQKVKTLPRNKTRVISRGSSFRYSGRTQKQLAEFLRENFRGKSSNFERSVSGRISRSSSGTPNISARLLKQSSGDLHNTSASSGSHILEHTSLVHHHSNEAVDNDGAQCDSSLQSPKLDRSLSHPDAVYQETPLVTEDLPPNNDVMIPTQVKDTQVPEEDREPLPHMQHLNMSAPLLNNQESTQEYEQEPPRLSRSEEIENIPETVQDDEEEENVSFNLGKPNITNGFNHTPYVTSANIDVVDHHLEDIDEREENMNNRIFHERPTFSQNAYHPHMSAELDKDVHMKGRADLVELEESHVEISGDTYAPPPPPIFQDLPSSLNSVSLSSSRKEMRSNASVIDSNISTLSEIRSEGSDDGDKHKNGKHFPADKAYYIAKEMLMTERTYKKDLEVITVWFKNSVKGQSDDSLPRCLDELFKYIEPIYTFHVGFLKEIEQRLALWEGKSTAPFTGDYQRIGDIMVNSFLTSFGLYMNYLEKQDEILMDLEQTQKTNKEFACIYQGFEAQKVCYLPLNTFLLKPGQRILHYKLLLERLTRFYPTSHPDYMDCFATLTKVSELAQMFRSQRKCMENLQKLMELQRDLVGFDSLVHPDREFIREGCLQKFSRKGYQQRMFFLFSDMLIYTSRTTTALLQFKVHGQVPLRGMIVEHSDHAKMAIAANSFAIYGGNKCILVAASSQEEKDKWIEDLNESVLLAKSRNDDIVNYPSLKSNRSSTEDIEAESNNQVPSSPEKQVQHRANTTMHVCWHRNTSVSKRDHEKAAKNQLSGYLLRKFKNSNGWQKLWVVFTNFCLYFYKASQDDYPLASLPLLGYAVSQPEEEDEIHKEHVFKLQFKSHVYYFRAESEYIFERWMEVINSATNSARRIRLFSRLDSVLDSVQS